MRRTVAVLVAACCLLAGVGGGTGPGAGGFGGASAGTGGFSALQTGEVDPDAVVLHAEVQADGDAVWTIEYRVRLEDDNATAAFRSLQADIRNNSSAYVDQFARRMRSTVAVAENATGREMAVSNVTISTRLQQFGQRYGVVSYRFVWEGFAATGRGRLAIGDALAGFFLDAESRLIVSWPAGYELRTVAPDPADRTENSVTWVGPTDFAGDEPQLVVATPGPLPVSRAVAAGIALIVLGAALLLWRRGRGGPTRLPFGRRSETDETGGEPAGSAAGASTEATDGETAEGEATEGETAEEGSQEPPPELLSPEERVLGLLEERGGRMKQKEVTDELDWSAARTSQVVGDLREAGEVESFRLGRENVLRLPEDDEGAP